MLQKIISANMGKFKVVQAQVPHMVRAGAPLLKFAVPVGGFVLWAAWPAAGDTVMGRNQPQE